MNILVTGRTGFIARHLVRRLSEEGHTVIGFYGLQSFYCSKTIDAVVHLAAQAGIRPNEQDSLLQYESNVMATVNILDLCVKYKVKKFVFISSSSVYGNPSYLPVKEEQDTNHPLCHYAATKKAGELACHTYHHLYGLDITVLRPFTVYGPGQRSSMAVPVFTSLIREGKKVVVFGDGKIQRDYIYVADVVDGIIKSLFDYRGYAEYNLGTGTPTSISDLISKISICLNRAAEIQYVPVEKGEALSAYASVVSARNQLGFEAKYALEEGLRNYINCLELGRR